MLLLLLLLLLLFSAVFLFVKPKTTTKSGPRKKKGERKKQSSETQAKNQEKKNEHDDRTYIQMQFCAPHKISLMSCAALCFFFLSVCLCLLWIVWMGFCLVLFFFWLANWPNDRSSELLVVVCLVLDFNVRYMVAGWLFGWLSEWLPACLAVWLLKY